MKFSKVMKNIVKMMKKADPKIVMLVGMIITLAVFLVKEKNHKCDCPVCKECECDGEKKVTFAEKTELIDTSQPIGPIA